MLSIPDINQTNIYHICVWCKTNSFLISYTCVQIVHFFPRSTDAKTELNGWKLTAWTETLYWRERDVHEKGENRKEKERKINKREMVFKCLYQSYVWSFKIDTNLPLTFHTNTEPSAAPAAMWLLSGLNAIRLKSHPTLKLSWLRDSTTWLVRRSMILIVSSRTHAAK